MKVTRRRQRDEGLDERRTWLRFSDGLIVDAARCPRGQLAHSHWRRSNHPVADGEPNTVCLCVLEPEDTEAKEAPCPQST